MTASDVQVESQWYQALYEEDCLRVMELLDQHPSLHLWKQGWRSEPKRMVEGSRGNYWNSRTQSSWKGRTALHVGARRGCVKLLKQVLTLYNAQFASGSVGDEKKGDSGMGKKNVLTTPSKKEEVVLTTLEEAETDRVCPADGEGDYKKGTAITGSSSLKSSEDALVTAEGEQHVRVPPKPPPKPSYQKLKTALSVVSKLKRVVPGVHSMKEVNNSKFRRAQSVAHFKRDVDMQERISGRTRSMRYSRPDGDGSNLYPQESREGHVSLEDLLLAKDGEYKLDAIAMAMVNGNLDVVTVLLKASMLCDYIVNLYRIRHPSDSMDSGSKQVMAERRKHTQSEHAKHKTELRKITRKVIEKFSRDPFFETLVLQAYAENRDFNFLPLEEYLFHFLFTVTWPEDRDAYRIVIAVLGDEVSRSSLALWSFLWEELQDGQGRLPLHVAADERTLNERFGDVFRGCMPGDKERIEKIIKAADGGGRTAFHRAITRGCPAGTYLSNDWEYDDEDHINDQHKTVSNTFREALTECRRTRVQLKNPNSNEIVSEAFKDSLRVSQSSMKDSLELRSDIWLNVDRVSLKNDFQGFKSMSFGEEATEYFTACTPLHSAIIHKRLDDFEEVISHMKFVDDETPHGETSDEIVKLLEELFGTPFQWHVQEARDGMPIEIDSLMLAALVGDESTVATLFKLEEKFELQIFSASDKRAKDWDELVCSKIRDEIMLGKSLKIPSQSLKMKIIEVPSLHPVHLAAATGKYEILKLFTDHVSCDHFVQDCEGNNALHHATKGHKFEFQTHLLDHVSCQQILNSREGTQQDLEDSLVESRQGCVNLLIQLGCDILQSNNASEIPYPGHKMHVKFRSWWHQKQAMEFVRVQNSLGVAANAISVTATLVATASYVGPLQPPLGYDDDSNELQVTNIWVKIFILCDTLSFYLAIAAIISSLIPSLPMPQQSMMEEFRRTRRMVTLATTILVPSIFFILIAFASSSIAVVHSRINSWNHGGLTLGTASVGGLICLVTIVLFSVRLAAIVFRRKLWVRKVYLATSF